MRLRDFIKHVYVDRRYSGDKNFDKPPRVKSVRCPQSFFANFSKMNQAVTLIILIQFLSSVMFHLIMILSNNPILIEDTG